MNSLKFLFIPVIAILISCGGSQSNNATKKVKSYMQGTYVRAFEGEYSQGNDTLIINQPDENNNYYTIKHNTSYQKIRNKQVLPLEYKTEDWIAIFNEQTNLLEEQTKGKLISFLPDEDALLLGSNKFEKIK
ncbi:MAG TPA: hypothetical protein VFW07_15535 [Parafilimonas sp.]|nr:hypothetical protein [Parafilimonas sp.]